LEALQERKCPLVFGLDVAIDSASRSVLLLLALLLLAPALVDTHAQPTPVHAVATQVCSACQPLAPNDEQALRRATGMSSDPSPSYDEQLGMTFTQSFTAMLYNVTAIEQSDSSSGVGPGYFLNGLSNTGYWYQVSLSYNWPHTNGGYEAGFHMGYEAFNTSGSSIFPVVCCTGLLAFSGPVDQGDNVALNLYFTNSSHVVFLVKDYNTGAYASETYSAEGATYFVGLPKDTANSNGFFTGLMTEWYRPTPYYGSEQEVTYSSTYALSSASMWTDEFNNQNRSQVLFDVNSGLLSYSNPIQFQEFSSNGATEYSNAYEFITGALSQVPLTVSYSVQGGGMGYSPPILTYVTGGVTKTATLGTSLSTFNCDPGSSWSVNPALGGSSSSERWETDQIAQGTASVPQTITFVYYNQYQPTLQTTAEAQKVFDSGTTLVLTGTQFGISGVSLCTVTTTSAATASCQAWVDSGGSVTFAQFLTFAQYLGNAAHTRWQNAAGSSSAVTISSASAVNVDYYKQVAESVSYSISDSSSGYSSPTLDYTSLGSSSATYSMTRTPTAVWLDYGTTWSATANPLTGSTSTEKWDAISGTSGPSSPGGAVDPEYFHQFLVTISYSVTGGGSPSAPVINETALGRTTSDALTSSPSSSWLDSGSVLNLPASLLPSSGSERWATNATLSLVVQSAVTDSAGYQHQYYVDVESAKTGGGSVSPGGQWYDAASTLSVVASPSPGWSLGIWTGSGPGSYSGGAATTSLEVEGPINETAVFYPGLNLSVESGGSVTYSYGSTLGRASSGQQVLYVPPGTNVTLVANPSSVLYAFGGWATPHASTQPTIVTVVNAPATTEAKFSYNVVIIGGLVGVVAVVAAAAVFYRSRINGRTNRAQSGP
jgi:hypothetical protein